MKEDSNIYYTENELKNKLLTPEQVNMFFRFIDSYQENNELKDELKYLVEDYNRVIISALNLSNQSQRNVNYSTQANYSTTQLNYRDYPISNENSKIENVTTNNMKPNIDSHNDYIDSNSFIEFIEKVKFLNKDFDIMIEAKAKDDALFRLIRELKYKTNYEFIDESSFNL